MTSKQRAYLQGLANKQEPVIHIGKNGVTPEVVISINEALEARELIKIAVLQNCEEEPSEVADIVAGRTQSECVHTIGRKFVLYRQSKTKPVITLPKEK